MLDRALDFKKVLEAVAGEVPNYMFLGDLNTMGMQYKYLRERDIAADLEMLKAAKFAEGRGMRLLAKDEPATWWNGGTSLAPSNLDQVVAVEHMAFKDFSGAEVRCSDGRRSRHHQPSSRGSPTTPITAVSTWRSRRPSSSPAPRSNRSNHEVEELRSCVVLHG